MNEIKIFENPAFGKIRTAGTSEEPLFCLADVCKVLEIGNPSDVAKRLDTPYLCSIEVGVVTGKKADGTDAVQNVPMIFMGESNLYRCIFQSRKQQAKPFQDWVCGEVLPTIRRTGSYGLPQTFAEALRLAADQQERIEAQARQIDEQQEAIRQSAQEVAALNGKVAEMKQKANYADMVLMCKGTVNITQIAQDYGMSARAFNAILQDHGIQRKVGGQWVLYSKFGHGCYVQSETISITHTDGTKGAVMRTKWTQEGRLFLYDTLKRHGILPLIEQTARKTV